MLSDRGLSRILILTLCSLATCSASKIVLVVPPTASGNQYKLASEVAANQIYASSLIPTSILPSPITITTITLSGSPQADLDNVVASTQNCSLAVVASSQDILTATFADRNIPVALVGEETTGLGFASALQIRMSPQRDLLSRALTDLINFYNWNTSNLVFTPSFESYATQVSSTFTSRGFSIRTRIQLDASSPTAVSAAIATLEKSSSRIVMFIGTAADLTTFLARVSASLFEVFWIEPNSVVSVHTNLNTTALYASMSDATPLGLFSLGILQNMTATNTIRAAFVARDATAFAESVSEYAYHAYDAVMIWANAVVGAGGFSDSAVIAQFMRNTSAPSSLLSGSSIVFDGQSGDRVGAVSVLNLGYNRQTSTATWSSVGQWRGGSVATLTMSTNVRFADGSTTIPSQIQRPAIPLGLVWWDSTNPTWRFLYSAWRNVTQWAMDEINATPSNGLGGSQLKLLLGDNQDSASQTILAGVDLNDRGVVGYLGPARSQHSIALQYYAGGLQIPHISFASTSDSLSDKRNYPTFFRTIIPDRLQGKALAALLQYYNWTSCCVMNYDDDYSNGVANNFIAEGSKFGMKVLARSTFLTTKTDFNDTFSLIKSSGCKIIVAIIDFSLLPTITLGARRANLFGPTSGNQWLFPEAAAADMYSRRLTEFGLNATDFNGALVTNPLAGRQESALYQRFIDLVRNKTGAEPILYQSFLWDAVYVYASAIGRLIQEQLDPRSPTSRTRLLQLIKLTSFQGVSGPVSFDGNQDRVGVSYGLYNYRADVGGLVEIGTWTDPIGINLTRKAVFSDGTETIPTDLEVSFVSFSSGGGVAIIVFASICLALISVATTVAVLVEYKRRNTMIIRSSPRFLLIILGGLTLALISVYFWFGTPSPWMCHMRVWFAFIGCGIFYSALLTKNYHVWYLFNEPSLRIVTVSLKKLLSIMLLVVAPLAIVLILWSAIAPFRIVLQDNPAKSIRYMTCRSDNDVIFAAIAFAYMGLMFVLGAIMSFKTRTLPDTFRESYWIALSTYNLIFVSAVGILVGYILSFEPTAYPYIVCICIIFCCIISWALIFVPKFWVIWVHPEMISDRVGVSRTTTATGADMFSTRSAVTSAQFSSVGSDKVSPKAKSASRDSKSAKNAPPKKKTKKVESSSSSSSSSSEESDS